MIELYHAGSTACSKKVRLCLKEKSIPYLSRYVDLSLFEHHDPEYLKLNPNGLVPTLVHNGTPIIESGVINEYLDDVFPDVPLRPIDPVQRASMRVWGKLADEALGPNLLFALEAQSGIVSAMTQLQGAQLEEQLDKIPLSDRRAAFAKLTKGGGFLTQEREAARAKAEFIVGKAERALGHSQYLAGDEYSLADINMIPFIDRFMHRVIPDVLTLDRYPLTVGWHSLVMKRPKVIETFSDPEAAR
jgi:glutathione S-transferase